MSSYAQESNLYCRTKKGVNGKTIIESMFFTPPLKIIAPFYENDMANIMLLNVSAGLMAGDKQTIVFDIQEYSKLKITSQSYEKIHNTQNDYAMRNATLNIADNAFLIYTPLPCIPFANSSFKNTTTIHLQENSTLYYGEIFCAGRIARDEIFLFKHFHQKLFIYKNNTLLFYDNMNLKPTNMYLTNICMFHNFTHYLHFLIYDKSADVEKLQSVIEDSKIYAALSVHGDIIVIKALANESEDLLDLQIKLCG
ncbi:Urease accessory protein UreH [Helicobacter trogontum]|uniref:Urease accessory protein UreH n=1 Tax=Helicobacter trogontum TaxID=50960 RepID=A0ABQ0D2Z4_9HELI